MHPKASACSLGLSGMQCNEGATRKGRGVLKVWVHASKDLDPKPTIFAVMDSESLFNVKV